MNMNPEAEKIGHRIKERVLASGLLGACLIEQRDTRLVLSLHPIRGLVLFPRVMRFCVNFLGERSQPIWRSRPYWCCPYVEVSPSSNICRVSIDDFDNTSGYACFDVLAELIVLGLQLSQALPTDSEPFGPGDLMRVYTGKEDVLARYASFVARVIKENSDLPTAECEPALRNQWLCCPKHRLLLVQRLLFNDWLEYFFWGWDSSLEQGDSQPDVNEWRQLPSQDELLQLLSSAFTSAFTAQEYLKARFAHATKVEEHHWGFRGRHCPPARHINFKCCSHHLTLGALSFLYDTWLEYFDDLYHMSQMKDARGEVPGLLSVAGFALLIHAAGLDPSGIPFTTWFEEVPTFDVSVYHRRQTDGGTEE